MDNVANTWRSTNVIEENKPITKEPIAKQSLKQSNKPILVGIIVISIVTGLFIGQYYKTSQSNAATNTPIVTSSSSISSSESVSEISQSATSLSSSSSSIQAKTSQTDFKTSTSTSSNSYVSRKIGLTFNLPDTKSLVTESDKLTLVDQPQIAIDQPPTSINTPVVSISNSKYTINIIKYTNLNNPFSGNSYSDYFYPQWVAAGGLSIYSKNVSGSIQKALSYSVNGACSADEVITSPCSIFSPQSIVYFNKSENINNSNGATALYFVVNNTKYIVDVQLHTMINNGDSLNSDTKPNVLSESYLGSQDLTEIETFVKSIKGI
ncbi:MAG: hypothetical protein WCO33_02470 [bacterium]